MSTTSATKTYTHEQTYVLMPADEYIAGESVDIYRCDQTGRVHVVDDKGSEVHSVMPWDCPDGGVWFARCCGGAEVGKVSTGRSRSHVMRTLLAMRRELCGGARV